MARGKSGRVVLEIDPELKRQLYVALELKQKTMKEWFVSEAESFICDHNQASLFSTSSFEENKNKSRGDD